MFLNIEQIRQLENQYDQENTLMKLAVAELTSFISNLSYSNHYKTILVVVGCGNNGCDALYCALNLQKLGFQVDVFLAFNKVKQSVEIVLDQLLKNQARLLPNLQIAEINYDLILDGILGIGINQEISLELSKVFDVINKTSSIKIAIDTPSGLDPFTGKVMGSAIKCHFTVTFIGNKAGLYTGEGIDYAGKVIYKPLIEYKVQVTPNIQLNELVNLSYKSLARTRQNVSKGDFGTVAILGGALGMQGAIYLAGIGALYSGSGKVILYSLDNSTTNLNPPYELMHRSADKLINELEQNSVTAIGPGFGTDLKSQEIFINILKNYPDNKPLIIDADGINLLAMNSEIHNLIKRLNNIILTPHPKEASRLLNVEVRGIQNDRVKAALEISKKFNAIVVLKGAGSLIVKDEKVVINTTGNPSLSVSGSGDLLTGLIASLIAQNMPEFDAVSLGAYLHGLASDLYSKKIGGLIGIPPSEIALEIRNQLNKIL